MNTHIDPEFASALRSTLLEQARPSQSTARRRYRRTAFIGLGSVVGLGVMGAAAAAVFGLPGAEVEKSLSAVVQMDATGRASMLLGTAPKGANAVHFELECKSPGTFVIADAGVVVTCDKGDVGLTWSGLARVDSVQDGALAVTSKSNGDWNLRAWYVDTSRAPLATNKSGETYGIDSEDAHPDLIFAAATNGEQGYVRRSEVEAAEAKASQSRMLEVPVYEIDGKTVIGTFTWGG